MTIKCQVLDSNGRQCRRPAKYSVQYHGEEELYHSLTEPIASWVQTNVCSIHVEAIDRFGTKRRRRLRTHTCKCSAEVA